MLPSLPQSPIAHSPSALISATISLLIEPASTISTISTVFWSVTRSPPSNFDSMPILASIAPICGPPPCTTIGLTSDCFSKRDVARKGLAERGVAHGMAAVLHDDGLVLVALHIGQRCRKQRAPASRRWRRYPSSSGPRAAIERVAAS